MLRRLFGRTAAALLCLSLLVTLAPSAQASTYTQTRYPIVLAHGFALSNGVECVIER